MKDEALKLADEVEMWGEDLLALNMKGGIPVTKGADMIRKLVAELDIEKNKYELLLCDKYFNKKPEPLSDEEIIAIFESPFHKQTTGKIDDEVIAFARAIEERHGIK